MAVLCARCFLCPTSLLLAADGTAGQALPQVARLIPSSSCAGHGLQGGSAALPALLCLTLGSDTLKVSPDCFRSTERAEQDVLVTVRGWDLKVMPVCKSLSMPHGVRAAWCCTGILFCLYFYKIHWYILSFCEMLIVGSLTPPQSFFSTPPQSFFCPF